MPLDLSNAELRELLRFRCDLTQYKCLHHQILTTWCRVGREEPYLLYGCECQDAAATRRWLEDPRIWERFNP